LYKFKLLNSRHEAHESRHWAYCHTLAATILGHPSKDTDKHEQK